MECRAARCEGVGEPRPRDIGQHRIHTDVVLEGCLGEAHDPPLATPRAGFVGIVEKDESARAERRIDRVFFRPHVAGQRDGFGRDARWRGNLSNRQIVAKGCLMGLRKYIII